MKTAILLISSLGAGLVGSVLRKYFCQKNNLGISGGYLFNSICSFVAAMVLMLWGGIDSISLYTILMGTLFGLLTALQGITNLLALQTGPLSYTSVIISFSTVISALSGVMFFGESMDVAHIVGIILMLISFIFAADKNSDDKKATVKWMIFCLIAFWATGFIGVMQKIHQNSNYKDQLNLFLVVAFGVSALSCAIIAVFTSKKSKMANNSRLNKKLWLPMVVIMIISGICVAVNNKFNLYLSGVMESAVFFPIVNGGGLILTIVSALLIFRERLSKKQWIGLIFGILSVVFLCNPF